MLDISPQRGGLVCSFVRPMQAGASGNLHRVFYCQQQALTPAQINGYLRRSLSEDCVLVVIYNLVANSASVCFFQHGYEIKRCGSGVLASAAWLHENGLLPALKLTLRSASDDWCISAERTVSGWRYAYLARPLPALQASRAQLRWQRLLLVPVERAFYLGTGQDYVHLVLASQSQLAAAQLHCRKLCLLSGRAVIVSAPSLSPQADYYLRYFAPQYGNNEDAATGSAHLQVAQYWQQRLGRQKVIGRQLATAGGLFYLQAHNQQQKVSGFARFIDVV